MQKGQKKCVPCPGDTKARVTPEQPPGDDDQQTCDGVLENEQTQRDWQTAEREAVSIIRD